MTARGPVLKHVPEDFVVRETMVVPLADATAEYRYLLLRKSGYTTMEAIRHLAAALDVASTEVTYGGLKDEDGVTEQLVAVPAQAVAADLPGAREDGRWWELHHYGYGPAPLSIGRLEGNGFRVVVRNMAPELAERFAGARKITTFFLNYYDTQRFGVPNGPKRTHLVGAAMVDGRWDEALHELAGLGAPESATAAGWTGHPKDHFRALDPRTASFYLAAHSSHGWNAALRALVGTTCGGKDFETVVDGIPFRYVNSPLASAKVLAASPVLPFTRYGFVDGEPVTTASERTTVVQTTISVGPVEGDPEHAGRHRVALNFFLPSGSYATAALRQITSYATLAGGAG
ncbi:tRNA pseudouridine(13) synthase TruD [Amycolatopsis sp. GM8]|uniref:tRNA pseudouridine(13) synthase TruD n=1 Tax=Amycolatopsis sp. GM8 TaxID=2896530 RepID=UPI001EFFAE97|nr:tRNA pseudouridine(13) synthase TruD [Amycolatopsis sp. GM8]